MTATAQPLRHGVTNATGNVLSVYLNVDQSKASNLNRRYENALMSDLKVIGDRLSDNVDRKDFHAAAALVQELVGNEKPSSKALVVFADSSRVLFSRGLDVDISTSLHWGKPYVAPFVEALDEFERCTIVVTNKWRGRVLSVFLGRVESSIDIEDAPHTTHIRATGMDHFEAQARDQRHADENTKKHLKHLLGCLESVLLNYPSGRIVLGGNVEAVSEFLRLLPKPLKSRIIDTLHSSMADSLEKVVEAATEVSIRYERDYETRSIAHLLELVGQNHKAVTGAAATLSAVRDKRLFTLYYAEGFNLPGKVCVACGSLYTVHQAPPCASCGAHLEDSADLLDQVLIATINCGARIEQVRGEAANKLRNVGGIGAVLRY
jgi:hypothetical protein